MPDWLRLRLDRLNPQVVQQVVQDLPRYVTEHNLPYGILNDIEPESEAVATALELSGLAESQAT